MAYRACHCTKPFINAVTTSEQAIVADQPFRFNQIIAKGPCIGFIPGGTTFSLPHPGVYKITFDGDVVGAAAAVANITIENNSNPIPGGTASRTLSTTAPVHFHAQAVVAVRPSCKCINNTAHITVISDSAGTLSNANIIIERID